MGRHDDLAAADAVRDFSWRNNESSFALSALSGNAALNDERLQLMQLQLQQDATTVSAELRLDNALATEGSLQWQTRIAEKVYSGELMLTGSLQQLQLEHVLTQPFQVTSSGAIVPGVVAGPELGLDLREPLEVVSHSA